jgi:hypothetical protein
MDVCSFYCPDTLIFLPLSSLSLSPVLSKIFTSKKTEEKLDDSNNQILDTVSNKVVESVYSFHFPFNIVTIFCVYLRYFLFICILTFFHLLFQVHTI